MLKFESIIRNLTLDEKISFITSNVKYASSKVENYDLPVFKIEDAYEKACIESDLMISYKSLLSSWDEELAKDCFDRIYNKRIFKSSILGLTLKNAYKKFNDGSYSDDCLLGKFLNAELIALSNKNCFTCLTDFPKIDFNDYDFELLAPYLMNLNDKLSSVILKTVDSLKFVNEYTNYSGYKFFDAKCDDDCIYALNNGAIFVFYDNAKEAILNALDAYDTEFRKLENDIIKKNEFEELIKEGKIISERTLNEIVNKVFEMLLKLDDSGKDIIEKPENDNGYIESNKLCESIIVLKNKDVLPIENSAKIGIIGDFANNFEFFNKKNSTVSENLEEVLANYDLNITEYSYGYVNEDIDLERVYLNAQRIANESTYVLLFLGQYDKKNKVLPKKELDLIDALNKTQTKIIAIVNSDDLIDYSFADKVDVLIQTNMLNRFGIRAILDVILGISTPSGKLTRKYGNDFNLGYGIDYGIFEYSKLSVTKQGLVFNITNAGGMDSIATPEIYISKPNCPDLKLFNFKKEFIRLGETAKIFIPFDEFTFKVFDPEINKYKINAGKYEIIVSDVKENILLSETIELDEFVYDKYTANQEMDYQIDIKTAYNNLVKDETRAIRTDKNNGMSKGKKLTIAILLGIYYNALLIFVLIYNLIKNNYTAVTIICIVLLVLFDAPLIYYIVKLCKNKNKDKLDLDSDIDEVVEKMESFDTVSEVIYEKPKIELVKPVEEEVIVEEVKEEAVEEKESKELSYDKTINEVVDDNEYSNDIDFSLLVNDFIEYSLNSGLIVEPRTARSIFGAIAQSKMIFLKSQSTELTNKFAQVFTNYMQDEYMPIDLNEVDNLYWIEKEDTLSRTKLANDLLGADNNKNKIFIETFINVNMDNVAKISDYLDYSFDPNNSINVQLSDDEDVLINKNMYFFGVLNDDLFLEKIDRKVANSSIVLELYIRENEIINEEPKAKYTLSYLLLENKIKDNRNTLFVDEDYWKKLDDVEEDLNNIEPFQINNKMTLAIEKMASIMLEAGSDITEVLDYYIALRIVPFIKIMEAYKKAIDESNFKSIIVNRFSDDTIPVTERALKKPL